jgi:ADP-heptose:LPS heptosyltransferase
MVKYLFLRTDRIGDFLLSAILIKSIKRNDPNSHITVICSNNNYDIVKKINIVDEAILYPKNLVKKIIFFLKFVRKSYFFVGVLDGKKRSIYLSILVNAKVKILCTYKKFYKIILSIFYKIILLDTDSETKIIEIKNILEILKFNFNENDLNFLSTDFFTNSFFKKNNSKIPIDYNLFHFDEKWIYNKYIKSYTKIEPDSFDDLINLFSKIVLKTNKDIFITSGVIDNDFYNLIRQKFTYLNKNIYVLNLNFNKIFFFDKLSFYDLSELISKSNLIISNHGSATHIAATFNVKIIDIVDKSEEVFFHKWSSHFKNYNKINRESFIILSKKIINLL